MKKLILSTILLVAPALALAGWSKVPDTNWSEYVGIDEFTDKPHIVLNIDSINSEDMYMAIECKNNVTSVFINFDEYLSNESVEVKYRFDSETAKKQQWVSVGEWAVASKPIAFIKGMMKHDRLIIKAIGFNKVSDTLTFEVKGLQKAIGVIRKNCNW